MTEQEILVIYHAAVAKKIELIEGGLVHFNAANATASDCSRVMEQVKHLFQLKEAQLLGHVL